MSSNSEVKALDLATFGDISDALQNFASDGNEITARFISHLESQVSEMEEVCNALYSSMQEAAWRLDEARNDVYRAASSLSFCESQVYTSYSYDDEGNCYEETIYPDCSYESAHLSRCEDARYDAARAYEAAEELYHEGKGLLTAAQECLSNFQAHTAYQFLPLLNNHTPAACRKLAAIAADLYGYLDTRLDSQTTTSYTPSNYLQSGSSNSNPSNSQAVIPPTVKPAVSKQVLQEENDHFSLSFQDKLGRNVQAKWAYKEDHLVAFESLSCDDKNVMEYKSPVQFTITLDKGYDFEKNVSTIRGKSMRIHTIYLLDEFKGSGIGGEIVRQLESLAQKKGCSYIEGTAEDENAQSFFTKMGFTFEEGSRNFKKYLSTNQTEVNRE